jgi:hypothetical protein
LTVACALSEVLITFRFSKDQFPHWTSNPPIVVGLWAVFFIGINLFTLFYFFVFKMHLKDGQVQLDSAPPSPTMEKPNPFPVTIDDVGNINLAKKGRRTSVGANKKTD